MKRVVIILFVILISFALTDCKKKNYPSDIPKWLKEKIDKMNKDYKKPHLFSKERYCNHIVPREVLEYTDGSSTFYWIGSGYGGYIIYNYTGDTKCNTIDGLQPCSNYGFSKYFVRRVWNENCR